MAPTATPPNYKIQRFLFGHKSAPLSKPYKLSFSTINNFESVWVIVEDEYGRLGVGEAVPLPGYSHETVQDVIGCMQTIVRKNLWQTAESLKKHTHSIKDKNPFAASAIITAMEFPFWLEKNIPLEPIPLIYPLSSGMDEEQLITSFNEALSLGYKYFKLKVGMGLKNDLRSSEALLKASPEAGCQFSFDANQAYNLKDASTFCNFLFEKDNLGRARYLEQPFPANNWKDLAKLIPQTPTKIALDESVFEEHDILRAKEIGCSAIKLKLCKHYGLNKTLELARKASELGLEVIFGNGVATDIGNLAEALIYSSAPNIFAKGAECNGYIKLKSPALIPQMKMVAGNLHLEKSEKTLTECIVESIRTFSINQT